MLDDGSRSACCSTSRSFRPIRCRRCRSPSWRPERSAPGARTSAHDAGAERAAAPGQPLPPRLPPSAACEADEDCAEGQTCESSGGEDRGGVPTPASVVVDGEPDAAAAASERSVASPGGRIRSRRRASPRRRALDDAEACAASCFAWDGASARAAEDLTGAAASPGRRARPAPRGLLVVPPPDVGRDGCGHDAVRAPGLTPSGNKDTARRPVRARQPGRRRTRRTATSAPPNGTARPSREAALRVLRVADTSACEGADRPRARTSPTAPGTRRGRPRLPQQAASAPLSRDGGPRVAVDQPAGPEAAGSEAAGSEAAVRGRRVRRVRRVRRPEPLRSLRSAPNGPRDLDPDEDEAETNRRRCERGFVTSAPPADDGACPLRLPAAPEDSGCEAGRPRGAPASAGRALRPGADGGGRRRGNEHCAYVAPSVEPWRCCGLAGPPVRPGGARGGDVRRGAALRAAPGDPADAARRDRGGPAARAALGAGDEGARGPDVVAPAPPERAGAMLLRCTNAVAAAPEPAARRARADVETRPSRRRQRPSRIWRAACLVPGQGAHGGADARGSCRREAARQVGRVAGAHRGARRGPRGARTDARRRGHGAGSPTSGPSSASTRPDAARLGVLRRGRGRPQTYRALARPSRTPRARRLSARWTSPPTRSRGGRRWGASRAARSWR